MNYIAEKAQNGGRSIHDLLDFTDIPESLRKLVGNYSINLIEIKKIENTDRFQTDLKQVFDFMRFSEDKQKLRQLVEKDPAYQNLDQDAYDVAAVYTGAKELMDVKKYHERGGYVNMCKALTEMLQDERGEGRAEGLTEGRIRLIMEMFHDNEISLLNACKRLGLTEEEFLKEEKKYRE